MKLYGLKNCDSCKSALRDLTANGFEVNFIDLRANPVSIEVIDGWLAAAGDEVLVNRKSTTWRGLGPVEREMPARDLLEAHPTLIKRPVIEQGGDVHVGWTAAVRVLFGLG